MDATAFVARPSAYRTVPLTGFYPLYDDGNDQVDPVAPIARAAFQRVIPRYRLSSSETRDTGLGPAFYEVPVFGPAGGSNSPSGPDAPDGRPSRTAPAVAVGPGSTQRAPLHPWQGRLVDLLV